MKRIKHLKKIKSLTKFYDKLLPQYTPFELPTLTTVSGIFGMSLECQIHTSKHRYNKRPKKAIRITQQKGLIK